MIQIDDTIVKAELVKREEVIERPTELKGSTIKIKTPITPFSYYVTINWHEIDGVEYPFEVFIDSKNNYWIATDDKGWGKCVESNKKYVRENFDNQNQDTGTLRKVYAIQAITEDKSGKVYFGSRAFSLIIKKEKGYFFSDENRHVYPYPAHTINTIFCDSTNRIWIGAWDNVLHTYNPEKNTLESIRI